MNMTNEQMRIAIAEACGWEVISNTLCNVKPDKNGDPEIEPIAPLPDYLNDLNACAEFEKTLTDSELWQIDAILFNLPDCRAPFVATARQRCIAFLKTKGLIP